MCLCVSQALSPKIKISLAFRTHWNGSYLVTWFLGIFLVKSCPVNLSCSFQVNSNLSILCPDSVLSYSFWNEALIFSFSCHSFPQFKWIFPCSARLHRRATKHHFIPSGAILIFFWTVEQSHLHLLVEKHDQFILLLVAMLLLTITYYELKFTTLIVMWFKTQLLSVSDITKPVSW